MFTPYPYSCRRGTETAIKQDMDLSKILNLGYDISVYESIAIQILWIGWVEIASKTTPSTFAIACTCGENKYLKERGKRVIH